VHDDFIIACTNWQVFDTFNAHLLDAFKGIYEGAGALQHYFGCEVVTRMRPDLGLAYSELSQYVQFPGKNHMFAAELVLSYLRGS